MQPPTHPPGPLLLLLLLLSLSCIASRAPPPKKQSAPSFRREQREREREMHILAPSVHKVNEHDDVHGLLPSIISPGRNPALYKSYIV
ncbi:hypothetical protein B0T24DRAFT_321387 [Lasiosphaeria ovina]|uniref:Uncharacterized protein n=1 Tax=Lasiosphaeria ovina TaxID=92902 RepID=A0AAE0K889_9PEZI|nr:hypothetical protein B0T24DRAFT_321387 [Lasiosphaeria ovina]